jgi:hypothetical protein
MGGVGQQRQRVGQQAADYFDNREKQGQNKRNP